MDFAIDRHLTLLQIICLPFYTPFSIRHLKKEGWLNKTVGFMELVPIISLAATGIELLVFRESLTDSTASPYDMILNQRVIIVANRTIFMDHYVGEFHPESPQRVAVIENALKNVHLMTDENTISPRQATTDEISLCHDKGYQEELKKQIASLHRLYKEHGSFDCAHWKVDHVAGDFQISPKTYDVALYAAGAPLTAIDTILNEKSKTTSAFCIVRPPGHHAHRRTGSGFCVFNNVAIAAKYLVEKRGFKRVVIVDWDAHHGDGSQELTESDPRIFYFSIHWDTSTGFYPGPNWGRVDQTGIGKGKGTVLNCPITGSPEECRQAIFAAFRSKLIPAMDIFQPEFILISCGFDAHEKDPLVGMGLNDEDYGELTKMCLGIAEKYSKGRIVSVLEGGYDLEALAGAANAHVETLMASGGGTVLQKAE